MFFFYFPTPQKRLDERRHMPSTAIALLSISPVSAHGPDEALFMLTGEKLPNIHWMCLLLVDVSCIGGDVACQYCFRLTNLLAVRQVFVEKGIEPFAHPAEGLH